MASNNTTTDHKQIKSWAEARNARPAKVKTDDTKEGSGIIRLDFEGYESDNLQTIEWEEWFQIFDKNKLALLYQDETSDGKKSNFNKLINR